MKRQGNSNNNVLGCKNNKKSKKDKTNRTKLMLNISNFQKNI